MNSTPTSLRMERPSDVVRVLDRQRQRRRDDDSDADAERGGDVDDPRGGRAGSGGRGDRVQLSGAFTFTPVPARPRRRGERRSLRTLSPVASLRPSPLAFDPDTPRRLSTSNTDAFQPHPDVRSYGQLPSDALRHGVVLRELPEESVLPRHERGVRGFSRRHERDMDRVSRGVDVDVLGDDPDGEPGRASMRRRPGLVVGLIFLFASRRRRRRRERQRRRAEPRAIALA
eukprot:31462-Pelagococcus_subviridis.AAC.3